MSARQVLLLMCTAGLWLVCSGPSNPYDDPARAALLGAESLRGIETEMDIAAEAYPCSVAIFLPQHFDSVVVWLRSARGDVVLARTPSPDERVVFALPVVDTGIGAVRVLAYRDERVVDSLRREFNATIPPSFMPIASADSLPVADSLALGSVWVCSIAVAFPWLVERFRVYRESGEEVVELAGAQVDTALIVFALEVTTEGEVEVEVELLLVDGTTRTLRRTLTGVSYAPVVRLPVTLQQVWQFDTVALSFDVSDPDGNMLLYTFSYYGVFDTSEVTTTRLLTAAQTAQATVIETVVPQRFDTLLCRFQVMDAESTWSNAAVCTLVVQDSLPPLIVPLPPYDKDSLYETGESDLPLVIRALVLDSSGIDSVRYNDRIIAVGGSGDTVSITLPSFEVGVHSDTLRVRDRAGNVATHLYRFDYRGTVLYPVALRDTLIAVAENDPIPSLRLSAIASITAPGSPYGLDDVSWELMSATPNGLLFTLDTALLRIHAAVPDSEWNGTDLLTVQATTPDSLVSSATITYIVVGINDPPVILLHGRCTNVGTPFDTLDLVKWVRDPDHEPWEITWQFTEGKYFRIREIPSQDRRSRLVQPVLRAKMLLPLGWTGSDTLGFVARDPAGAQDSVGVVFTVADPCFQIILPPLITF